MSSSLNRIKKSIMASMQSASKQGTSAYDTTAVVRRIEGDTAWVHIAGGVDETPVKLTIAAKAGDTVQVRVGGGRAWITGNATAPPTDDQLANAANKNAIAADVKAGQALKDASDAMEEAKFAQDEANQLAVNMANAVVRINADIENLQDQIDGNITTWFYDYDPTNSNLPASEWIAEGTESAHIGDLFYNNTSGYSWRWQVTNGSYSWQRVTDTDVAKALADAAKAQDTADSKRRVFYAQPISPPYDKGDLWVQGSGGDILRCARDKVEGQVYEASDWVLASKYTDDSTLNNWLANTYAADKSNIQSQIDGKAETWYQAADPATNWTAAEKQAHTGDLWYRTSDGTTWYYTGSAWNQQQVPTSVFNAIDGKANIFIGNSTPQSPKEGDLWMQSANDDILTYVGNRWVKYNKYTDDSALNTWLAGTYATDKANIQNQLDGKAETWYQSTDPSTNWTSTEKPKHEGDLWYNTSDNTTWYYTGSAWSQQNIPTSLFNTFSGKANIFVGNSTPTDPKDGDLWMQSASSDILTYVGNSWTKYNKYTDDTVASEAKTMATATQEHFWTDSAGAHITRKTQQAYSANPANGGGNTLLTSNGMKIRDGETDLSQFLSNKSVIGKESGDHVTIDSNGFTLSNGQTNRIMLTQVDGMQAIQFLNHNMYIAGEATEVDESVTIGSYGVNDNLSSKVEIFAFGSNGASYFDVTDLDAYNPDGVVISPKGQVTAGGTIEVLKDDSETARVRVVNVQGGDSVDLVSTSGGNVGVWSATRNAYLVKFDPDGHLVLGKSPRIGSHTSAIGDDIAYTENSRTSVSDPASLGYIDLPAGTWLIRAYVTFAGTTGADGYRRAYISDTAGNMVLQSFGVDGKYGAGNNIIVCNPYRVVTVSSTTRYYLNASAPSTITISNRSMRAVRLV